MIRNGRLRKQARKNRGKWASPGGGRGKKLAKMFFRKVGEDFILGIFHSKERR